MPSFMTRYLAIVLLWLFSLIGSSYYFYNKGVVNERNSLEVLQLKILTQQQNLTISKQQKSIQNMNIQLFNFSEQLQNIQESYQVSQLEVHKYEKLLNNSNRINALFLRTTRSLSGSAMAKFSTAAGNFNAESAASFYVPITGVVDYQLQLNEQYDRVQLQLNSLIDWLNEAIKIYNERVISAN